MSENSAERSRNIARPGAKPRWWILALTWLGLAVLTVCSFTLWTLAVMWAFKLIAKLL